MAFQYVLPHTVTAQLDSLRRRVRRVAFLRGCGLFLTISCGLLISILLTDFLLDLQSASRLIAFPGFCFAETVLAGFLLIRPLVIPLKDAEIATLAEERFPELGERVSSLVELSDPEIPESEKGSPLMRDLLEEETVQELARCDFNEAVSARPAIRRLSYGVGALSFLILSLLIFPSVSSLLLARLFKPWGNYESVSRLTFDIEEVDQFVARGDDIEIAARMAWRNGSDAPIPEPVELSWQSDNGNADVRTLRFDPERNVFATVIPNVQDSLKFFVSSDGSRSRQFHITVLDRPEVLTAKLEITPPGYRGQPRESIDGVTGDITIFEHSRLVFDLTFSHPVEEASINWLAAMVLPESKLAGDQPVKFPGGDPVEESRRSTPYTNSLVAIDDLPATQLTVSEDGLSAHLEMPATVQGAFRFLLKESHGLTSHAEPHRQINIIRDQPPLLEVPGGHQDRARPIDVYGIRVSAVDDVALEKLELHVTSREGLNQIIRAPESLLGQETLEHEFRIDLADVAVRSGDFLKLQIRAVDGRPTPGPNEVWSEIRYVAISEEASAQGTGDVLARQEQIRKELQDIRDQLRTAVQQSDDLRADAQRSLDNDRDFAQQQAVQTLASDEEELAARMAGLADQFSRHPLFANLSDNLWRLAADELDPVAMNLASSPQQDLKEQVATIDENSTIVDMVEEGVSSIAAEFAKLAALEEDLLELNRIAQRANQLVDDARQLEQLREEVVSQATDTIDTLDTAAVQRQETLQQELSESQQLLMEEQSELVSALENLLHQRPELLQAARDHQLEKLAELARQAGQIAEPQKLLAESLERDAEQAQQAAAPLAERQREISQQIDQLAARAPSNPELRNLAARQAALQMAAAQLQADRQSQDEQQAAVKEAAQTLQKLIEAAERAPAEQQPAGRAAGEGLSSERLAAQAEQLADLQQQLQQAIGELGQQQPAVAQTNSSQSDDPSPPQAAGSEAATPPAQQQTQQRAQQTLNELLTQQETLTDQAAQLAVQSAQQTGADSEATQAAAQAAQQSAQAESAARGGQFAQAAREAANAQQTASESASALGEAAPALAEQARQLADQQQQMSQAFEQLENSPAQRAAAQLTQQEQLAAQADQIAQALDELARQLGSQPLDLQQQSEQASSAQQSAQQGQQAASQAAQSLQAGNQSQAARSAQQAADALRQSAQQAAANATPSSNDSPVPGEFAAQIADAMRQLQAARQQLAQAAIDSGQAGEPSAQSTSESGQPAPGSSEPGAAALDAATGEAAAAQPSSGENPPGSAESAQGQASPGNAAEPASDTPAPNTAASDGEQSEQPSPRTPGSNGQPGPSPNGQSDQQSQQRNGALAEATDALQQAAEMLSDAAGQLAADGSQSGDNQGQSNQQPPSQQPGLGNSGTGAFVGGDIDGPLDTELKRRAMKNWGKLPGNLKTEILQSSQRRANGDYAKLIKLYFEELARAGQTNSTEK